MSSRHRDRILIRRDGSTAWLTGARAERRAHVRLLLRLLSLNGGRQQIHSMPMANRDIQHRVQSQTMEPPHRKVPLAIPLQVSITAWPMLFVRRKCRRSNFAFLPCRRHQNGSVVFGIPTRWNPSGIRKRCTESAQQFALPPGRRQSGNQHD